MNIYLKVAAFLIEAIAEAEPDEEVRFLDEQGNEYYATLTEKEDNILYVKLEKI